MSDVAIQHHDLILIQRGYFETLDLGGLLLAYNGEVGHLPVPTKTPKQSLPIRLIVKMQSELTENKFIHHSQIRDSLDISVKKINPFGEYWRTLYIDNVQYIIENNTSSPTMKLYKKSSRRQRWLNHM